MIGRCKSISNIYTGRLDNTKQNSSQPNFKGGLSTVLGAVESNPVLSLLAIDMFGMIIPRSVIDLNRNKEELKHKNWDAGRETFLREISTAFMLYFMPGLAAIGVGKAIINRKINNYKLDTKSFIDFDTLNATNHHLEKTLGKMSDNGQNASLKEIKTNFIENIFEELKPADSKIKFTEEKTSKINSIKNNLINELANNTRSYATKEDRKLVNKKVEDLSEALMKEFEGSQVVLAYKHDNKDKKLVVNAEHFIRDLFTICDDTIDKTVKVGDKVRVPVSDNKLNIGKFKEEFCKTVESLGKIKKLKTGLGFGIGLLSLIIFPKVNIWITQKISHNKDFPGVRGLVDNNQPSQQQFKNPFGKKGGAV